LALIKKFVETKSGTDDAAFWTDIVRYETESGCGDGPYYIDGWISAFSVFTHEVDYRGWVREGKKWPRLDVDFLTSGIVTVPVKIDENGTIYNSTTCAGHLGNTVVEPSTIQLFSGWGIALNKIG
jgi:hypothetical protein